MWQLIWRRIPNPWLHFWADYNDLLLITEMMGLVETMVVVEILMVLAECDVLETIDVVPIENVPMVVSEFMRQCDELPTGPTTLKMPTWREDHMMDLEFWLHLPWTTTWSRKTRWTWMTTTSLSLLKHFIYLVNWKSSKRRMKMSW